MHLWRQKLLVETSCQIQGKHDLNGAKARFNMNIRPWNGKLLTVPTIITAVITSYELWPSHPLSVIIQMQYTCNAYVTSYWISTLRDYGHYGKSKIYVGIITFFFFGDKSDSLNRFSVALSSAHNVVETARQGGMPLEEENLPEGQFQSFPFSSHGHVIGR